MGHEAIFPPWLERLMDLAERQWNVVVLVTGYALCRCASHLSFQCAGSSDLSTCADAGKIAGLLLLVTFAYGLDREHQSFKILAAPGLIALAACGVLVLVRLSVLDASTLAIGMFLFGLGTAAMMLQWLEFVSTTSLKFIVLIIETAEGINSLLVIILGASLETVTYCMPLLIAISLTLLVGYRRMVEESHAPSLKSCALFAGRPARIYRTGVHRLVASCCMGEHLLFLLRTREFFHAFLQAVAVR